MKGVQTYLFDKHEAVTEWEKVFANDMTKRWISNTLTHTHKHTHTHTHTHNTHNSTSNKQTMWLTKG